MWECQSASAFSSNTTATTAMAGEPLSGISPIFYVYFAIAVVASAYSLFLACQLNRYIAFTLMVALGCVVAFDNIVVAIVIDNSSNLPDDLLRTRFALGSKWPI